MSADSPVTPFPSDRTAAPLRALVLDTATDVVHLGLIDEARAWTAVVAGGAQSSASLLPAAQALLSDAGLTWADLTVVGFGRGPGAFTGLRTACSVTQGLALAADCPVIPIDTLLAVAEDARLQAPSRWLPGQLIWVVQDARMDELYAAAYRWTGLGWETVEPPALWPLDLPRVRCAGAWVAGNALRAYPDAFDVQSDAQWPDATPSGAALVALARQAWARGAVVDAALALPLYVRDKVAQTTAERQASKRTQGA